MLNGINNLSQNKISDTLATESKILSLKSQTKLKKITSESFKNRYKVKPDKIINFKLHELNE